MTLARFLNGIDETTMGIDEERRHLLDAMRFFVGKICEEQLAPKFASHEFVSAVTGLCYTLLCDHLPKELLAFAKHANRKVIQDEDLFLYARKTSLQAHLREHRDLLTDSPKKQIKGKAGRKSKMEDFIDVD